MMKILVTGGAGYLGSVLVPILLRNGFAVTVLDSFRHQVPSLAAVAAHRHLTIVCDDVRNKALLSALIVDADVVVPLAAIVGQRAADQHTEDAYDINAGIIQWMVSQMTDYQALIYPCTNSGYGLAGEQECDESSLLQPTSHYGKSKVLGEQYAMAYPWATSLRFATLFGSSSRMRLDLMVNDFVYRAVHGLELQLFEGQYRRNFLHVRDAARAIMWAIGNKALCRGHIFNVGDSRANMTKSGLCGTILRYIPGFKWQESAVDKDPDQRDYIVSNRKIEREGWAPVYTIDDGIVELRKTYQMPFRALMGPGGYRN